MVNVMNRDTAEKKARNYSWMFSGMHHFAVVPFNEGFAVIQTDCTEPHYLCNRGFLPINEA